MLYAIYTNQAFAIGKNLNYIQQLTHQNFVIIEISNLRTSYSIKKMTIPILNWSISGWQRKYQRMNLWQLLMEPHITLPQRFWKVATLLNVITGRWVSWCLLCWVESHPMEARTTMRSWTMFCMAVMTLVHLSGIILVLKLRIWYLICCRDKPIWDSHLKKHSIIHGYKDKRERRMLKLLSIQMS